MILGLELTLLVFGVLAAFFALARYQHPRMAMAGLVCANVLLLGISNWAILVFLVAQAGWTALLYMAIRSLPLARAKHWAWLVFLGLVPLNLWRESTAWGLATWLAQGALVSVDGAVWYLGASFAVVKCFVILRERLSGGPFSALAGAVNLTFVPAYAAGPIYGCGPWRREALLAVTGRTLLRAMMRFGWGAAAFYILAPRVIRLGEVLALQPMGTLLEAYMRLAALYLDFSGYTAMALAMASLFGAQLPENFNRPYLATSIRDFWRRWHMSLSGFIGQYLFKPFVRKTGARGWGITFTFIVTGLWHQIGWPYLLWGLAHGLAMAGTMQPWPVWERIRTRLPVTLTVGLGWFTTMTGVAIVSYLVQKNRL